MTTEDQNARIDALFSHARELPEGARLDSAALLDAAAHRLRETAINYAQDWRDEAAPLYAAAIAYTRALDQHELARRLRNR